MTDPADLHPVLPEQREGPDPRPHLIDEFGARAVDVIWNAALRSTGVERDGLREAALAELEDWKVGRRSWTNLGPNPPYTPDVIATMDAQEVVKLSAYVQALAATPSANGDGGLDDLHAADVAAALVHDYIWQKPVLSGTEPPSREQASDAIWTIHRVLRPLIAALASPEPPPGTRP